MLAHGTGSGGNKDYRSETSTLTSPARPKQGRTGGRSRRRIGVDAAATEEECCYETRFPRPARSGLLCLAEQPEHGQHPAVLPDRRLEPQLPEDLADVTLHRLEFQDSLLGDTLIRPTLRHQAKDVALPRSE